MLRITSRSGRSVSILFLLGIASAIVRVLVSAQGGTFVPVENARELLLVAYPELRQGNATVVVTTDPIALNGTWMGSPHFYLTVQEEVVRPNSQGVPTPASKELLVAEVLVSPTGRMRTFRARGPLINTERLAQMVSDVNAHPRWSDAEIIQALEARGARFTPDQVTAIDTIFEQRVGDLVATIGVAKIRSVDFDIRDQDQLAAGLPAADLQWTIIVDISPSEIRPSSYVIRYEPFEGKLTSIVGGSMF